MKPVSHATYVVQSVNVHLQLLEPNHHPLRLVHLVLHGIDFQRQVVQLALRRLEIPTIRMVFRCVLQQFLWGRTGRESAFPFTGLHDDKLARQIFFTAAACTSHGAAHERIPQEKSPLGRI